MARTRKKNKNFKYICWGIFIIWALFLSWIVWTLTVKAAPFIV